MTELYLVRHASTSALGRWLAGRAPGIELDERGRREAEQLARRLSSLPLAAIRSSPLERARATALAVAAPHALRVEARPELTDIDFGSWTGKTFAELEGAAAWRAFNVHRSSTRPPGGEHIAEVQTRMLREVEDACAAHPNGAVVLLGHADPLKSVVGYYTGVPIDLQQRLEIAPASVSLLELGAERVCLRFLNDVGHLSS